GFALLSLTLLTGFVFAEQWLGRALVWDHKTVFSVLSWVSFAVLLAGRVVGGWRGRMALRWCLGSYFVLVLAYFGTQFVFEFVLG
ncbi:MAG: cytochrome c biogenesis protein CcsA, partial [Limnobacter sp.]|nr:cytochrome c biogenesis protein CcsA [Limnobacter sp.]